MENKKREVYMKKIELLLLVIILTFSGCGLIKTKRYSTQDPQGRKIVTIDVFYHNNYLEREIYEFNEKNSRYFVQAVTYKGIDYEDFLKLRAEKLLSGGGADIYMLDGDYRLNQYIEKGALVRMDPYIEMDIRKEDYVDHVFDICKYHNAIYGIPINFEFEMLAGSKSMFSKNQDVSFADLCSFLEEREMNELNSDTEEKINELIYYRKKMDVLWEMYHTLDLDIRDEKELRKGIELIDQYCHYTGGNPSGTINWVFFPLGPINSVNHWENYESFLGVYGRDFTAVNGAYISGMTLGINEASEMKEGAWEFIKFMLSEDSQKREENREYRTVYKTLYLEQVEAECEILEKYKNSSIEETKRYYLDSIGEILQSGKYKYLCNGDYNDWLIVSEEVQRYFNKYRGLDETIEIIKSRLRK